MTKTILQFGALLLLLLSPQTSFATKMTTPEAHSEYVSARLLLPRYDIRNQSTVSGAIEIKLQDGWHTYWRNPGEVGLPIRFGWEDHSSNVASVDISWPTPERFETVGIQNFGYKNHIFFPIKMTIQDLQKNATIGFDLNVMVCKQICIPQNLSLKTALHTKGDINQTGHQVLIDAARKNIPHVGDTDRISLKTAVVGPEALVFTAHSDKGFSHADLFLEHDHILITGKPSFEVDPSNKKKALIKIDIPSDIDDLNAELKGTSLKATFAVRGQAIEKDFNF